jgi:hypothetical protein
VQFMDAVFRNTLNTTEVPSRPMGNTTSI